jgi:hypothetical protein
MALFIPNRRNNNDHESYTRRESAATLHNCKAGTATIDVIATREARRLQLAFFRDRRCCKGARSATPPSTAIAIMPTRSLPLGAISEAGEVCRNAAPERPAINANERRTRLMGLPLEERVKPTTARDPFLHGSDSKKYSATGSEPPRSGSGHRRGMQRSSWEMRCGPV